MKDFAGSIRSRFGGLGVFRWVIIAWLLCAVYYIFLASDRYVPASQVYVKSTQMASAEGFPNLSMLATGLSQASPDLLLLQEYMLSRDMLEHLDDTIGIRAHYESSDWDFVSRLKPWASREDFLEYYRSHVTLTIDAESGIMTVEAEAFTPEFAMTITNAMLAAGEAYINDVGQRIAAREIKFVQGQVDRARDELSAAKAELLVFLSEHQTLSPTAEGEAFQVAVSSLRAELVGLRAQEKELQAFLNDEASELVVVRNRISAIESQLDRETEKLAGGGDASLGKLGAEYQELELKVGFATDIYKAALAALEQTRLQASQKLKHLVIVQAPSLPDASTHPRRIYNLVTIFVVLGLLFGIISMIAATVKEHRNA